MIPGDGRLIESHELFVNEAVLTGETFPAGKEAQVIEPAAMGKTQVYLGIHVVSGWGKVEILHTGKETRLGKIAERLRLRRQETEFERGVRRFGYLLAEVILLLVLTIFDFDRGFIPIVARSDAMNYRIMTTIHAMGLADSLAKHERIDLIDVRPREEFKRLHVSGPLCAMLPINNRFPNKFCPAKGKTWLSPQSAPPHGGRGRFAGNP